MPDCMHRCFDVANIRYVTNLRYVTKLRYLANIRSMDR